MMTIEKRLTKMLKELQKWKTETPQEEHDKDVIFRTLHYASTGRYFRPSKTKSNNGLTQSKEHQTRHES